MVKRIALPPKNHEPDPTLYPVPERRGIQAQPINTISYTKFPPHYSVLSLAT